MNFIPIDPIRALYLSAVINGVVAVPVMAIMMWLVAALRVMGEFVVSGGVKALGWTPRSWRSPWRQCLQPITPTVVWKI
jgi:Mn2+/Fe2+ NRAMP family transporter